MCIAWRTVKYYRSKYLHYVGIVVHEEFVTTRIYIVAPTPKLILNFNIYTIAVVIMILSKSRMLDIRGV